MLAAKEAAIITANVRQKIAADKILRECTQARLGHAEYASGRRSGIAIILSNQVERVILDQATRGIHSATWSEQSPDDSGTALAYLEGYRDVIVADLKEYGYHVVNSIKPKTDKNNPGYLLDIGIGW